MADGGGGKGGATMLIQADGSWRILLAAVTAALILAALPQAADAALTKRERCIAAAEKALGSDIQASDYRIVLGTDRPEERLATSSGQDLICGFGGTEWIRGTIKTGDIFISGAGTSYVPRQMGGLVIGGKDINIVHFMSGGRFYGRKSGEPGQDAQGDTVDEMRGGVFYGGPDVDVVLDLYGGRFEGGLGSDFVAMHHDGIFLGKRGSDRVDFLEDGRFRGGPGNDRVRRKMSGGAYTGGPGTDRVKGYKAGRLVSVEICEPTSTCP